MNNVLQTALLIFIGILLYHFRDRITGWFRRFDARTQARHREEMQDRRDSNAHYKHTMRLAEEQVEDVQEITVADERTAQPVKRYLFEAIVYATRNEAEEARAEAIGSIARGFYMDLPRALAERRKDKLH